MSFAQVGSPYTVPGGSVHVLRQLGKKLPGSHTCPIQWPPSVVPLARGLGVQPNHWPVVAIVVVVARVAIVVVVVVVVVLRYPPHYGLGTKGTAEISTFVVGLDTKGTANLVVGTIN